MRWRPEEWKQFTILVGASTFYASTADEDWGGKEGEGMEKLVLPPTLGLDTWVGRAEVVSEINYFARLFLEIVQSVVQRSQWREERAAADCHEVHKVPVYVSSTVVMNLYVYDVVRKWNFIVYRRCR